MQLFMLRSTMKSFSPTCLALSRPSGTCWSPRGKRSNMIWWVIALDGSVCVLWHIGWRWLMHHLGRTGQSRKSQTLFFVKHSHGFYCWLTVSEQCHPVPGIGMWEATLQASVWRSEHTHQHLWKGHRPQHGIQKYVQHFGSISCPWCLFALQIFWYAAFVCDERVFNDFWTGADEEAFEDNSEEYIIRDLEGSGMNLISSSVLL